MGTNKEISLEFIWDKEVYVGSGELAYKYKMKYTYKKYIGWAIIALFAFGLFSATQDKSYEVLFIAIVLMVYWFITNGLIVKSRLKRNFSKDPDVGTKMKFVINNKYIKINNNPIPWGHISLVVFSPTGFLLERNEGYPFIPISAFKSSEDIIRFKEIVENQTAMMREIK